MDQVKTGDVIILQGVSGSGKSTAIARIEERAGMRASVVSADHFFMVGGEYKFSLAGLTEAHATCFRKYLKALTESEPLVVVDNTNTSDWEVSPYILGANAFGYAHKIMQIRVRDLEKAATRNTHGCPLAGIQGQAERIANFKPLYGWTVETVDSDI